MILTAIAVSTLISLLYIDLKKTIKGMWNI